MENYYFTFGQSHATNDGILMKDYWVRINADSYFTARKLFVDNFSKVYMPAPDKWAFQYDEKSFDRTYYPKGECMFIRQLNKKDSDVFFSPEFLSNSISLNSKN